MRSIRVLMILGGLVAFLLVIMAMTNPGLDVLIDEDRRQFDEYLETRGKLERLLLRQLAGVRERLLREGCRRQDLIFFSIFTWRSPDESEATYVGAFGRIWFFELDVGQLEKQGRRE